LIDQSHLRLRKRLDGTLPAPVWPEGIAPMAFDDVDPRLVHAVLDAAFPGLVARFDDWYGNLTTDAEFDPALCVPAVARDGSVVGFAQCWTSDFVKDLAVVPAYQRRGLGAALMLHVFGLFAARGAAHVGLKVESGDAAARRFYARLGMVEVDEE
jgi:ribosomal protein S18 acetylase RimI-like enzyme